ncbi:SMR family transporter [Tenacibaculum mesophilum]
MNWIYLIIAGIFEIGWPLGLKLSQNVQYKFLGICIAIICMATSG